MRYGKVLPLLCFDYYGPYRLTGTTQVGHIVFIVLNLINNVFGCASMIMTGSQLIYGISGMHYVAATILIPLGGTLILLQ